MPPPCPCPPPVGCCRHGTAYLMHQVCSGCLPACSLVCVGDQQHDNESSALSTSLAALAHSKLYQGVDKENNACPLSMSTPMQALPHQLPDQYCSQPPAGEPYSTAPEEPARGLPLLGTVVMGLPVSKAIRQKAMRLSKAKQAKAKQPKAPKATQRDLASAPGQDWFQQEGDAPAVPDQPQALTLQQPKAKSKKKRPPPKAESPCRLPPISPGALSLQEGVKRRRLARQAEAQAEAQAAALAASAAASDCTHPAQPTEGPSLTATDQSSEAAAAEGVIQASSLADTTGQQQPRHENGKCPPPDTEVDHEPASTSEPCSASKQADNTDQSQMRTSTRQQPGQTLSFDVGAMELFQQQDTCDAFGSFWRRTSGIGTQNSSPGVQAPPAAPSAFGGKKLCRVTVRMQGCSCPSSMPGPYVLLPFLHQILLRTSLSCCVLAK